MASVPLPLLVCLGSQPRFLFLTLFLFSYLLLCTRSVANATLDLPTTHTSGKTIILSTKPPIYQIFVSDKNLTFTTTITIILPKGSLNRGLVAQMRRSGEIKNRFKTKAGLPRPVSGCSSTNWRRKQQVSVIMTQIFSPDFSISFSNPLISNYSISGGYIYLCYLMNVRYQNSSSFFYYPFSTMANINIEEELRFRESDSLEIEDEQSPDLSRALNLTLAGKLLATNRPSLSNLTFFASRTWDCPNRVSVFDHGRGLYTFQFILDSDVLKVILGGPWYIEGKLLLVQRINPNLSINNLPFEETKIWVRCFDLPPKAFNLKFAKAIGNMLGCFCESDIQEAGVGTQLPSVSRLPSVRKFLRIKVCINLAFPLKRSQNIRIRNSVENRVEEITVKFAYERLPTLFCYRCGLLGHDLEKCNFDGPILYGDWIRSEKFYRMSSGSTENIPPLSDPLHEPTLQSQNALPDSSLTPNPITLDPTIILANFKEVRALSPLPAVPLSVSNQQLDPNINALVPFNCSSSSNPPPMPVVVPTTTPPQKSVVIQKEHIAPSTNPKISILGAIPVSKSQTADKTTLPIPFSVSGPTYFNPMIPNSDLFSPNTQRCLFKSELIHPALASQTKAATTSPPELSPIGPLTTNQINSFSSGNTKEGANNKGNGSSKGKRTATATESTSKALDTPKPKRGRPPSGATKNA